MPLAILKAICFSIANPCCDLGINEYMLTLWSFRIFRLFEGSWSLPRLISLHLCITNLCPIINNQYDSATDCIILFSWCPLPSHINWYMCLDEKESHTIIDMAFNCACHHHWTWRWKPNEWAVPSMNALI